MRRTWRAGGILTLALILLLLISGCGGKSGSGEEASAASAGEFGAEQTQEETAAAEPAPEPSQEPTEYVYEPYDFDESTFVPYDGVVEHIFFHQVICYPELAFDGDYKEADLDDWMCTIPEFLGILDSLYEKGYILVNMNDVWSEHYDEEGRPYMAKNTIMVPPGRIPFVLSFDDINYYEYMLDNGFSRKIFIGDNGEIWDYSIDPQGNEVISQDHDVITLLDTYIKEHPDFSLDGSKGCLALTGYEGCLGYRTQIDSEGNYPVDEATHNAEVEAVKPVIEQLKKTGWYFGSHTWGHINLESCGLTLIQEDTERWLTQVGSLVGPTKLMFYPHGARPDGDDVWGEAGPELTYLHSQGFRVFAAVGVESFSKIRDDLCCVVCDRLHPDGTTLRWARERYLYLYDAAEVFDYEYRPDLGRNWDPPAGAGQTATPATPAPEPEPEEPETTEEDAPPEEGETPEEESP